MFPGEFFFPFSIASQGRSGRTSVADLPAHVAAIEGFD